MPRIAAGLAALLLALPAPAAVLRVGPGETITNISEAARVARDHDIVEIQPGEYRADVTVWEQKHLTIRGVGARPVLIADGASAEGKAIWVIRNGDVRIANIEFRGARAPDGNGAGIRFEGGHLRVSDCSFVDNQMGILTGHRSDATLGIENSLFANAPRQTRPLPHLLYVGRIAHLEVAGSRFHGGHHGHLIKSRARRSDIRYNLIYDGLEGEASYEVDLPNGGVAFLVGNIIGQSASSRNPVVVAYGAEGSIWPESALYLSHNTLLNDRLPGAWFLRIWRNRLPAGTEVKVVNNLTVGLGAFWLTASGAFSGNVPAVAALLRAPELLDVSLPDGTPLRYLTADPGQARGLSLAPTAEFALPIGTHPLAPRTRWLPGALQREGNAP